MAPPTPGGLPYSEIDHAGMERRLLGGRRGRRGRRGRHRSRRRRPRRVRRRRAGEPRRLRQREAQSGVPRARGLPDRARPRRPRSARSRCRACGARRRSSASASCVLGLGLIGQITVQLLRSRRLPGDRPRSRSRARRARARRSASTPARATPTAFKALVRDRTGGRGADRTLMTAATKSHAVVNLAMDVTRAKGTVVIVGDVGLNVERAVFYRKEIDLLMSTSYGPGPLRRRRTKPRATTIRSATCAGRSTGTCRRISS